MQPESEIYIFKLEEIEKKQWYKNSDPPILGCLFVIFWTPVNKYNYITRNLRELNAQLKDKEIISKYNNKWYFQDYPVLVLLKCNINKWLPVS